MLPILIVEDNLELAENLAEILKSADHETQCVQSAEEALTALANGRFAGVLTDLRLPGKSGLDLLRELRSHHDSTPLVLMTAFADSPAKQSAEELGALHVMLKPFPLRELFALVYEFENDDPSVLVVEDNAELAETLGDALRSRGLTPQIVSGVEEAFRLHTLPKVALVDLRLPDGSGLNVARRLGARDPNIAVLLISGYPQDLATNPLGDLPECVKDTFNKPIELPGVLDRVEREVRDRCSS